VERVPPVKNSELCQSKTLDITPTYEALTGVPSEDFHSLHSSTNIANVIQIKEDETEEIQRTLIQFGVRHYFAARHAKFAAKLGLCSMLLLRILHRYPQEFYLSNRGVQSFFSNIHFNPSFSGESVVRRTEQPCGCVEIGPLKSMIRLDLP
jgi:hypothetical protein